MSSNYPGGIDNFGTDRTDNTNTKIPASDINNLRHAVVAIENELGVNPKGTDTNITTRLDRIDNEVDAAVGVGAKIYGNVAYTDSIIASGTLTKRIPLGGSYKFGMMTIMDGFYGQYGVTVIFDTNNLNTKAHGVTKVSSSFYSGAWSRRYLGKVTGVGSVGSTPTMGSNATGNSIIFINECYIDSNTNELVIIFFNSSTTTTYSLNCIIDWEVWK